MSKRERVRKDEKKQKMGRRECLRDKRERQKEHNRRKCVGCSNDVFEAQLNSENKRVCGLTNVPAEMRLGIHISSQTHS